MKLINFLTIFCVSLGLISTTYGFKFAPGLVIPRDIPGDIKAFINGFYTAVDAAHGAQAIAYFSDNPKLIYNGKEYDGKPKTEQTDFFL
ncbi:hypothetical protein DFH28DRAFT_1085573 [Melampsora americana]|nr:hypothetical protein DFH28DRAFT_1085573 [Melampsora americana]